VWVTRDNGKTWKNVTPKELPPGGRVHTIEDSPHRRGSAYVSVYRMYLNDFKPYLYMTDDYGEHWRLLTDGTNGIPADQPMHVVREDPEREGLLYAGTLEGAYVSFDQGAHWQSLQQNLPATPVTDLKVHHGDLLASTMGRGFWILDDVAPLRQLAASVTGNVRRSPVTNQDREPNRIQARGSSNGAAATAGVVNASMQNPTAQSPAASPKAAAPATAPARPVVKPFDGSTVFLFTPAPAYRARYAPSMGRPDLPEFPPAGARIDYFLASAGGNLKLEILDSTGAVVREFTNRPAATGGGRGGRRGGGLPTALPTRVGMNRFVWDLRYAGGPATAGDPGEGGGFGGQGPLVAPGTYRARLSVDGSGAAATTRTESFAVKIDPRVARDGVTVADLAEQTRFSLRVRDLLADARSYQQRLRQAIDARRGDAAKLQGVWDKLVTRSGPYEDQMFIDQVANVGREVGQADQKVGASAYERLNELVKEWSTLKAEADAALR
jgi:hypothetical protein